MPAILAESSFIPPEGARTLLLKLEASEWTMGQRVGIVVSSSSKSLINSSIPSLHDKSIIMEWILRYEINNIELMTSKLAKYEGPGVEISTYRWYEADGEWSDGHKEAM